MSETSGWVTPGSFPKVIFDGDFVHDPGLYNLRFRKIYGQSSVNYYRFKIERYPPTPAPTMAESTTTPTPSITLTAVFGFTTFYFLQIKILYSFPDHGSEDFFILCIPTRTNPVIIMSIRLPMG